MARLHHYTGVDVELPLGGERVYGRADTNLELDKVSRQQFKLACTAQGLLLTSLGANPTKVQRGLHYRSQALLLQTGDTLLLAAGDRVLLLGCDPSMFVEVKAVPEPAATGTAAAYTAAAMAAGPAADGMQLGDAEPSSKRPRVEPDAAAASSSRQQQQEQEQQQQQQPGGNCTATVAAATGPVMLVLVGAQGAGKSTFCDNLQRATEGLGSQHRWVRVNQDSIAGGRPGKREQCVQAASEALDRGDSVLIDRTNVTPDQRRPFLVLAGQKSVPAHCLVLKLSRKLCGQRAAARESHEGGLHGKSPAVYQAVNRMWSLMEEAGDPQEREGFASVIVCQNDREVAAALDAWAAFGPAHPDPLVEYQRRRPPPPKVNTLFNYLTKAAVGSSASGGSPNAGTRAATASAGAGAQAARGSGGNAAQGTSGAGRAASTAGNTSAAQQQQQQQQAVVGGRAGLSSEGAVPGAVQGSAGSNCGSGAEASNVTVPKVNAFHLLMHPAKPAATSARAAQQAGAGSPAAAAAAGVTAGASGGSWRSRHTWRAAGPFANSLVAIASHPESCRREQPQLWFDDRCVWLADKFAKAREHWLVVAREPRLEGPLDLTAADIPLLEHMLAVAHERTEAMQQLSPGLQFRYGFHSVPSLRQLHMHVVSQDFDSPALKNKKHWNSFTSPFFLDAVWVLSQLRQTGRLEYSIAAKEALLKSDLRCHRCGAAESNMPRLKDHIAACHAPVQPPRY